MKVMRKFWNFAKNDGVRTLRIDGTIAEESWWGDEVTPDIFREELYAEDGAVAVWINSYGGDVFAAAQIYNMLKEYPAQITVKIDAVAASAASVIAMAGDEVLMSPVALIMIHNPATIAIGDSGEMLRVKAMLDEVKESIINAYENKTHLDRERISQFMDEEKCFHLQEAMELGFVDGSLFAEDEVKVKSAAANVVVNNALTEKLSKLMPPDTPILKPTAHYKRKLNLMEIGG